MNKLVICITLAGIMKKTNLDVVHGICAILDELLLGSEYCPHANLKQNWKKSPNGIYKVRLGAPMFRMEVMLVSDWVLIDYLS